MMMIKFKFVKNSFFCKVGAWSKYQKFFHLHYFITLMNTRRTSRSHHIDDGTHLIVKDSSNCYYRNNHNSGLIQDDELIQPLNEIGPRKRRRKTVSHPLSSSILLLIIRLMILLILCLIVYYTFISIYPKPKQNEWERMWTNFLHWFIEP